MIVGYARVSTDGQTLEAQVDALKAAGAEQVFQEKASGARAAREGLNRAIKALNAGDVFLVTRLDRLARSTRDIWNLLDAITLQQASFRSLADTWADTTTPQGRLLLSLLASLAEYERELIRTRTTEGRKRAVERGVKLGRTPKLSAYQRREILERKDNGEAVADLARAYAVSEATIWRVR